MGSMKPEYVLRMQVQCDTTKIHQQNFYIYKILEKNMH